MEQRYVWLFYYFDFKRNYDVLKLKSSCFSLNKKVNFNKSETESNMENPTHTLRERRTLCFSSYNNCKLKVKLWWARAQERKKSTFVWRVILSLMYSILNKISKYILFYISQNHFTSYTFLLLFKIVDSLRCIFKHF